MVDILTPFEALERAIAVLGTQAELARVCKVSSTAVWKWVQSTKRLPAEFVLDVERATGIDRHALRPDIYPRGLIDGVTYTPEEPLRDMFGPPNVSHGALISRAARCDGRSRFHGSDQFAGRHG